MTSLEPPADIDLRILQLELTALRSRVAALESTLAALTPQALAETLTVRPPSLLKIARERLNVPPDIPVDSLSPDLRYALFQSVFYESALVSAKQRIYLTFLDELGHADDLPFLDLGCGRGEFLQILKERGIPGIGVDSSALEVERLARAGYEVVNEDLLAFLETDSRIYRGACALQVAEHLSASQLERLLVLSWRRIRPGGLFIIETPNPVSPFALAHFHTDPTHVAPIPPDRLRYQVEAAGFERAELLFQFRVPPDQYAGPDARAHYMDYAVIAYRGK